MYVMLIIILVTLVLAASMVIGDVIFTELSIIVGDEYTAQMIIVAVVVGLGVSSLLQKGK